MSISFQHTLLANRYQGDVQLQGPQGVIADVARGGDSQHITANVTRFLFPNSEHFGRRVRSDVSTNPGSVVVLTWDGEDFWLEYHDSCHPGISRRTRLIDA